MAIKNITHNLFSRKVSIAPLVTFRVLFGLVMLISMVRFWANGWIDMQYLQSAMQFKFFGFDWVAMPPGEWVYVLFATCALSCVMIALGLFYRVAAVLFFITFTYIELLDATFYLNHYYFISLVGLLLVFLPANKKASLDVYLGLTSKADHIPVLAQNLVMFHLGLVYFFAGVAKLNSDWLFHAMPLAIWLPAQDTLPVIGGLLKYEATAYIMSWAGAIYDLTIPFFLLSKRFRWPAYAAVVGFHVVTWAMFQIGMFPFIMIASTLIFFSAAFHQRLHALVGIRYGETESEPTMGVEWTTQPLVRLAVVAVICFQLVFPFRHMMYDGNLYWHEQGYRFGWRVMLTEKAGYAQFKVEDTQGRFIYVDNRDFLMPVQEKMMSTQPDFMLQYAQFLKDEYTAQGVDVKAVTTEAFVTLNGRSSRPFIDSSVDLSSIEDSWQQKDWILPFKSDKG